MSLLKLKIKSRHKYIILLFILKFNLYVFGSLGYTFIGNQNVIINIY